ncbi:uncharacterized protein CELE_B0416.11 [Caenorhabditis elegans]|uniref:Uncharacterized protein n=1 Tax=Caenorhabditis elegans TaxID=6239 RepID=G1K0U7_CAEEL|nr:Uncharacterized protein CELE_B0416.11 [Caenorhabditis elegans]CCD61918.1 Uncharacterized protein CELE_B0416.11 [Caenorhabditis elegans]|eukprot:NP_001257073.1 Uncharacterized protein CELE_B0416.11 [Caenorhabditis elegans]
MMTTNNEEDEEDKKKKNNIFQKLVEESIKTGGMWIANPSKVNREEKREDDTGTAKHHKNYWNNKLWK